MYQAERCPVCILRTVLRPHLKISLFPVERPGEIILRLYRLLFFFCVRKIKKFQPCFVRFSFKFHHFTDFFLKNYISAIFLSDFHHFTENCRRITLEIKYFGKKKNSQPPG